MKPDMIRDMGGDEMYPALLFDSERFLLTEQRFMKPWPADKKSRNTLCPNPPLICLGFELVDKVRNKEAFFTGAAALAILDYIKAWQANPPHEEEVDAVFEVYAQVAQLPLCQH